jgi:hypothetical protein
VITWTTLIGRALLIQPDVKEYSLELWSRHPAGHELQCIWNAIEAAEEWPGAQVLMGWHSTQYHAAVLGPDGNAWEVTYGQLRGGPLVWAVPAEPRLLRRWGLTATAAQARESAILNDTAEEFEARCRSQCVIQ